MSANPSGGAKIEEKDAIVGTPSRKQLKQWATNYVALWNAGDRDGWARNWRSVAPGDFRMLDRPDSFRSIQLDCED